MSVKNRIQELQILNKHNISYYVYDEPTISDYQYDLLLKELESLKKHPRLLLIFQLKSRWTAFIKLPNY